MRVAVLLAGAVLLSAADFSYRAAAPGYRYTFPRDYFEHLDFRTEWWYYTGNVRTAAGKRLGFELVFFRQAQRRGPGDNPSAWRIDDLYLAHLALTDIDGRRFLRYRRLNRAGPGIAGASFEKRRIWNRNWAVEWNGEIQNLEAVSDEVRFRLRLAPLKPVVINGENGISRKGPEPGNASYYLSFPRLSVRGEINGQSVSGLAWMDHEWFTRQLSENQAGWDWFSIQLEDGADLMLFDLRRKDGSADPFSSGTYIDKQGRHRHLRSSDFSLHPLETWASPRTGAHYPIHWKIEVPVLGLALDCRAALPDQELPSGGLGPSYWEGAVTYTGARPGAGYLEMAGYDKPVRFE